MACGLTQTSGCVRLKAGAPCGRTAPPSGTAVGSGVGVRAGLLGRALGMEGGAVLPHGAPALNERIRWSG